MTMTRTNYDLTSLAFQALKVGRLQTIQQIPVCAGDSISLTAGIMTNLTPLRRRSIVQPQMLLSAFFVPMRHIYSNWVEYITEGLNENETLASWTAPTRSGSQILFLGQAINSSQTVPAHTKYAYSQIYRRYFRYPNDTDKMNDDTADIGVVDDNEIQTDDKDTRAFGYRCCHLPTVWNSTLQSYEMALADQRLELTSSKVDLMKLEQAKARFGSLQAREFWASTDRYKDILKLVYGTGQVNIDADERPQLLGTSRFYVGGYDVDATDTSSIGKSVGKGQDASTFGFPSKFFPEHGVLCVLALLRYPHLLYAEHNPLMAKVNPPYKLMGGDPNIMAHEPPTELDANDYFNDTTPHGHMGGTIPYGQEWRSLPQAYIHGNYQEVQGFPFGRTGTDGSPYVRSEQYDSMFQTTQLGHCQISAKMRWSMKRIIPPARNTIMVGATGR